MSQYPKFNRGNFGSQSSSIHRMTRQLHEKYDVFEQAPFKKQAGYQGNIAQNCPMRYYMAVSNMREKHRREKRQFQHKNKKKKRKGWNTVLDINNKKRGGGGGKEECSPEVDANCLCTLASCSFKERVSVLWSCCMCWRTEQKNDQLAKSTQLLWNVDVLFSVPNLFFSIFCEGIIVI